MSFWETVLADVAGFGVGAGLVFTVCGVYILISGRSEDRR